MPFREFAADAVASPGDSALRWAIDARRATAGGPEAVARRARAREREIVRWARTASPVFRERWRGLPPDIERLDMVPPSTKPELMARFDDWVADPAVTLAALRPWLADPANVGRLYRGEYLAFTTSGTTGEPAVLLQDRASLALYLASRARFAPGNLDRGTLARIVHGGFRTAVLLATGGPYGGVVMSEWTRSRHPLAREMRLYPVTDPLPGTVAALNRQQPAILTGYATALAQLAQEALAGRLRIDPAVVATIAEGLTPEGRAAVRAAWNARLIETYASSEAPVMAFTCGLGRLHQNADWVTLEPVDADFRPVPPGVASHTVLVTNLVNRIQPIVRYDQGDSITVDPEPCPCGSPLPVIRVEGRSADILRLAGAGGGTVRVLPLAIGGEAEEVPGVHRVQLVHDAPARLLLRLETEPGADRAAVAAELSRRLAAFLERQGAAPVEIALDDEPPRLERSGKFRQVKETAAARPSGAG